MRSARVVGAFVAVCALVGLAVYYLQLPSEQPAERVTVPSVPSPALSAPDATTSPAPSGAVSEPSRPVSGPTLTPVVVEQSEIIEVEVPQVGLKAEVGTMVAQEGVIDPPTLDDAFRVTSVGGIPAGVAPGSDAENATYIAGHTCRQCKGVFDALDQVGRVGDDVYLTTVESRALGVRLHYKIEKQILRPKGSLNDPDNEEWHIVPNRLVIITCHLRDDGGHQTDNRVFFAQYVGLVK